MPHSTQCPQSAPGRWSLSTIRARLTVPSGTSPHVIGGDTSSSVQLYFLGMRRVSLNFVLVTVMLSSNCCASAYSPSAPASGAASVSPAAAAAAPVSEPPSPLEHAAAATT